MGEVKRLSEHFVFNDGLNVLVKTLLLLMGYTSWSKLCYLWVKLFGQNSVMNLSQINQLFCLQICFKIFSEISRENSVGHLLPTIQLIYNFYSSKINKNR